MDFNAYNIGLFITALLIAMSFHEAMHAFTAHWLGDDTAHREGRLTLNPLAHIDLYMTILLPIVMVLLQLPPILAAKPVPFNPSRVRGEEFGAALVGVAGPLTNLLLAIMSAGLLGVLQPDYGSLVRDFLLLFVPLNVALFVFNMLPIPPLDGSRVLYAFAPEPLQRLMEQIESFGLIFVLVILFAFSGFLGPIISNLNDTILRFIL